MHHRSSIARRGRARLRWLVVGIALIAAAESLRTAAGDFLRLQPCAYLDRLERAGERPDARILGTARDRLELARIVDPANPLIDEYLAVVYWHRAHLVAGDPDLRRGYLESARTHYEQALARRPHSGYLWAGIMAVHAALLQSEDGGHPARGEHELRGLEQALGQALRLAPWEPAVLKAAVAAGTLHYQTLGTDGKRLVDEAHRRLVMLAA